MSFNPASTPEELAHEVCDLLVSKGQLREKPAFIRGDREEKIAGVFSAVGLDGAKMASLTNTGSLEMLLRKGTNGETWVQQVQDALVSMLPEAVVSAAKQMGMDEGTKEELMAAKEKSAQRRERMQDEGKGGGGRGGDEDGDGGRKGGKGYGRFDRDDEGGGDRRGGDRGGGGRFDRDDEGGGDRRGGDRGGGGRFDRDDGDRGGGGGRFDRDDRDGGRKGGGRGPSEMECYNCGGMGHSARDCPEPRKEKGGGKGQRRGDKAQQPCFNCGQVGHRSRDCPEPQKQLHKDRDLSGIAATKATDED